MMNDNFFENSVLFTQYLTPNFYLCHSALDLNGCRTLRFIVVIDVVYFSFQTGSRTCDDS